MGESDGTLKEDFYAVLQDVGSYSAYEFLLTHPKIIDEMNISELSALYREHFRLEVPRGELHGLTKILKERVFGEDADKLAS